MGGLRIAVRDNGVGIPCAMLEKVFDLFTQAGASLQRSQGGLGIWLSLARQMVELHGGSVLAESDGEQGSKFVVELPPDCIAPQQVDVIHPPQTQAVRRRMLLVDDNVDAAESLSALLQFDGHDVEVMHRGIDALAAAVRLAPEVVLLDIGLPKHHQLGDGVAHAAARFARSDTDCGGDGLGKRTRSSTRVGGGLRPHLTKPVTLKDLASALSGSRRHSAGLRL